MRLFTQVQPGVLELNWMWLPTWLGLNTALKQELDKELNEHFLRKELTSTTLDMLDEYVINFLVTKFPEVGGLAAYLRNLPDVNL
jgi:hypothetical protein